MLINIIEAVQAKVGVDNSNVPTSLEYRVRTLEGNPGGAGLDASRVSYTPPFTGSVTRTGEERLSDVVSVKDFGAVGDGATDDTAAVTAAWNYAKSTSKVLYIPAGTYSLATIAASLEPASGMVVYGDGMDNTVLKFNSLTGVDLIYRAPNLATLSSVQFRDFCVDGSHGDGGDYTQAASYPFLLYAIDTVSITRVKVVRSRTMAMALRRCTNVAVSGCVIQYCARDGINTADCISVVISGNRIEYIDDDAIACHSDINGPAGERGALITGNIIRFSQGIVALGGRSINITGNSLEFVFGRGILVDSIASGAGSEGVSPQSGIVISGNTIKNCIDRAIIDGLSSTTPYISISGPAGQAGGLAAVPGENDTATGAIVPLYPYMSNVVNGATTAPIPHNYSIVISGNVLMRDAPDGVLVSSLGYGQFYVRTGPVDPTLTGASLRQTGIRIQAGTLKNLSIKSNVVQGIGTGILMQASARLVNCKIDGNTFFDCEGGFASAASTHNSIYITNNVFDLDPLFISSNRGAGGTWLADGNPTAILIQSANGIGLGGNVFRNLCRISDLNVIAAGVSAGTQVNLMWENYIECDPSVAAAFSTSNRGIGNIPRGPMIVLRCVDSNPTSATYGQVLNMCPTNSSAQPTTGKYILGHIVRNNNPSVAGGGGSQYIVSGWVRVTTGSGHVLNTDWREMRTLTGT